MIGDTSPANKIGEASRAMLKALNGGGAPATIDPKTAAATLVFPGTAAHVLTQWPLDPARVAELGRAAAAAVPGGLEALKSCPGLAAMQ